MKFKSGDRVVLMCDSLSYLQVGDTGTVCCDKVEPSTGRVRVRWDLDGPKRGFHSCGDHCEFGYGYNVLERDLCFESEYFKNDDFDTTNDELFSLIGGSLS